MTQQDQRVFGFALAARSQLWCAVERVHLSAAATALSCYMVLVLLELAYPHAGAKPHLPQAIDREARLIMVWGAILLLLGAAHRFLRRDHPFRAKPGRMIFPSYVIHQPIIIVVGWALLPFALPASATFPVILACTIGGCWLFAEVGVAEWRSCPFLWLARGRGTCATPLVRCWRVNSRPPMRCSRSHTLSECLP